jgi:methylmalonyl-CoA mutase
MSQTASDLSSREARPDTTPLRFVTAASLFDGHDAAINIMRRIIQSQGAEVIHLGHNRSVEDVVRAALQEDADGIALSSYQGGHVEYFKYMVDMLRERGAGHIRVFGGGGGTITPEEIRELQAYGVERIYHPNDGMKMGLTEMIEDVIQRASAAAAKRAEAEPAGVPHVDIDDEISVGHMLTDIEETRFNDTELGRLRKAWDLAGRKTPVLGVTGTGGAGKSSVVDELLLRFLHAFPEMRIAVLAVDPTRRRSGGALLGDRIRMNSLRSKRVYMRSMATRRQHMATNEVLKDCIAFLKSQPYDLVIVETAGIGQSDSEIVDLVDFPVYVMTSDYGAASQLEKIDMIDFADLVVLNKFDKRGAEDALRDVRKQWKRNHTAFGVKDEDVPVYPTIASQFNDPGVTWMFTNLCRLMREKLALPAEKWSPQLDTTLKEPRATVLIPGSRVRYLAEIAEQGRAINGAIAHQAEFASKAQHYYEALKELGDDKLPRPLDLYSSADLHASPSDHAERSPQGAVEAPHHVDRSILLLRQRYNAALKELSHEAIHQLREWPALYASVTADVNEYKVRDKVIRVDNYRESLSHQKIPKVSPPKSKDWGELLTFLGKENLPGHYPYTGAACTTRSAAASGW